MERFLRLWCTGRVVRRGLKTALIVGVVLALLNHGDAILRGELTYLQLLKIAFTPIVPFLVSTSSAVLAMMDAGEGRTDRPSVRR